MGKGFIKNYDLIQEVCQVEDLLDFSETVSSFSKKLDSIERSSIIGLVGPFGSGKSTMLYQLQCERKDSDIWINFDAWKYPDRKDLWEGFVLDFAEQIGSKKKILGKVEGKDVKSKAIDVVSNLGKGLSMWLPNVAGVLEVFKTLPAKRVFLPIKSTSPSA